MAAEEDLRQGWGQGSDGKKGKRREADAHAAGEAGAERLLSVVMAAAIEFVREDLAAERVAVDAENFCRARLIPVGTV